jgi:hypothetical protein
MKLLAVALILPATILIAIVAFETQLFYPPPSNAPTKGIVWDGRTFASHGDFARWLRSRGESYAVWARRHPSLVGAGAGRVAHPPAQKAAGAKRASEKGFDWSVVGGGLAALAGLGLAAFFLRRRRSRLMLRGTEATALLLSSAAKSSARIIRRRGPEFAGFVAHRAAPAARGGARLTLRSVAATALLSSSLAASSADTIRRRRSEFAWYLASGLLAAGIGIVATVWLNRV